MTSPRSTVSASIPGIARGETAVPLSGLALLLAILTVAIEGYDLSIFALFSVAVAHSFFPTGDPTGSLLLAVGTLGVGYCARPVGGILVGAFADRAGRSTAMTLTVLLMAGSTGVIGLIPGYDRIGLAAPILVLIARLVQGVSAGGATPSSLSYLVEAAPPGRRGYYSAYQQTAQVAALLFASGVGAATAWLLTPEALAAWGWRIPFLLALLTGPFGLLLRHSLPEPEGFAESAPAATARLGADVLRAWRHLIAGIGLCCLLSATTFVLLFYLPTYAQTRIGLSSGDAFLASAASTALLAPVCLVAGALSDRIGRRPVMIAAAMALLVLTYPLIGFAHGHATLAAVTLAQCALSVLIGCYTGVCNVALAELFPARERATCIAISFNFAIVVFGAFGPFAVTWLMRATGDPLAISYYVCGAAVVSLATMIALGGPARPPLLPRRVDTA